MVIKVGMILSDENRNDEEKLQAFFTFLETENLCPQMHFTLVLADSSVDRTKKAELCSCDYLYYHKSNDDNDTTSDAKRFTESLSQVNGMVMQEYSHVDAIKWDLLMEIARADESGNVLLMEKGEAKLKGRVILQLQNVPVYGQNKERRQAWTELASLEKTVQKLKADYVEKQGDDLFRKLLQTANQFEELSKDLDQRDETIYKSCQLVLEGRKKAADKDSPLYYAEICMREGDIETANTYLRDNAWRINVKSNIAIAQDAKKRIRSYIAGQRLLISNLQTVRIKEQKLESQKEIEKIYHDVVPIAEEWQVELDLLYEYAWFLFNKGDYKTGTLLTKRLINYVAVWQDPFTVCLSEILYLLGSFYEMVLDFSASEKALNEAQAAFRSRKQPTLRERENMIAVLNQLGTVYWKKHIFDTGLRFLIHSEEEIQTLQAQQHDYDVRYDVYLGTNYHRQAVIYRRKNEYGQAQYYAQKALDIRRTLMGKDFYKYAFDFSTTCNNYAVLCKDLNQFQKAEKLYKEAIAIRQRLTAELSSTYEASVAVVEGNYATLLEKERRDSEAEQYFQEAIENKKKHREVLPEKWQPSLAYTCIDYGNFLAIRGKTDKAQPLYKEAISIRKKLKASDEKGKNLGNAYRLAIAYANYGYLLCRSRDWELALDILEDTLQEQEELIKNNRYPINKSYLYTTINYANALAHFDRGGEACGMLQECIRKFEKISVEDPLTSVFYAAPIALAKRTLAHLLAEEDHMSSAEQNCVEAMNVQRQLATEVPQVYELELGLTYRELGLILEKKGEFAQAETYHRKAEAILKQYPDLPKDYISDLTVQ
ncbi:MAG: tetratricopeptide repeat protein [Candidatus Gastranaerophilales bacterium]|nr:tetratricopeptide repeat protein [Candidatus Gastranaerophilales bacterium]